MDISFVRSVMSLESVGDGAHEPVSVRSLPVSLRCRTIPRHGVTASEARVEFRILGPMELLEGGLPVEVSGRRQRALLVLLLLHANEIVSSDRLIEGLWGERPPATAAKVLQNAVSQLRRSLGDNLIVTRTPGYMLRVEPDAIDTRQFEALLDQGRQTLASGDPKSAAAVLREALALWRGPPLDEFSYEPFAEAEITRLEELHLRALEERIEAELALGLHSDLAVELERLVAEHPLRERPREQLMLALYRSGRQAEALRAYEDGRRLLAEELGLEPGATLRQLERHILTQDPALEPPPIVPPRKEERPRPAASEAVSKRPRGRRALGLAAIAVIAAALVAAFLLTREDARPGVVPNSLAKIDPKTGEIVEVFRVGLGSSRPTVIGGYIFVSSDDREILTRIDVRSGEMETFGGLTTPADTAAGADRTVWVGSRDTNKVWQIDADSFERLQVLELPEGSRAWRVAVGGGSVWVSEGVAGSVSRFNARTGRLQQRYRHEGSLVYSAEVAFGEGAAWTAANGSRAQVLRVDAVGGGAQSFEMGQIPYAVAIGFGAVWVSDLVGPIGESEKEEPGKVLRLDPATGTLEDVINVGKLPDGLATGGGSVWVANGGERTISEIDPRTNEVVNTIHTRYYPTAVAYTQGFLWVSLGSDPFSF
jgi:DNA-binding SARP family transcriptional activator/streptogramin lyase